MNDHPILGSPFKVNVETSFEDKIDWGNNKIFNEDFDDSNYYVSNNLRSTWKIPKLSFVILYTFM